MARPPLSSHGLVVRRLLEARGALFAQEMERGAAMLPSHLEMGLSELIGHGMITCDSFSGLRRLLEPPSKRSRRRAAGPAAIGRWSLIRAAAAAAADGPDGSSAEFAARRLLDRYGVVFRRVIAREKIPIPWRDIVRACRHLELKGEVRGGRFVAGFAGEQYAWPAAVELLNGIRGLDLLTQRPEVDAQRLGVTGISGGGAVSWWIAAGVGRQVPLKVQRVRRRPARARADSAPGPGRLRR